jgi:putative transposase
MANLFLLKETSAMTKPTLKPNRTVGSEQVLEALLRLLVPRLPLDLKNTRITAADLWHVLAYAAVHQTSPEAACQVLADAPSGNRLREVLKAALPDRAVLQRQLNTLLRAQLPKSVLKGKRSYCLAGDITLIPYHGQPEQDPGELVRGVSKSGTTHFHGYATLAIVHNRRRYVIALKFLSAGETTRQTLRWLLDRVKRLEIKVRRIYLDKGFCNEHVFRLLDRRGYSYIVPLVPRGKAGGVRKLWHGATYATTYTLKGRSHNLYTLQVVVVRRFGRRKHGRRSARWFGYAVAGLPPGMPLRQVFQLYRQRFGIESTYRQLHQVRARTASRSPVLRLLLVGLALILVNLYVALRTALARPSDRPAPRAAGWFSLPRLRLLLGRAVANRFGFAAIAQCRPTPLLS